MQHRLAVATDLPALHGLMDGAIRGLIGPAVDGPMLEAHIEIMGVDTQLIADSTYFVVEIGGRIAGCGGWSYRETLFGGDHTAGRNARLLNPAHEAARVRAMYTDPAFTRRGVGRTVLALCEAAAAAHGFTRLELFATMAGEPLYAAYGFAVVERVSVPTSSGIAVPGATMAKPIDA